jgi:hypothetical protein
MVGWSACWTRPTIVSRQHRRGPPRAGPQRLHLALSTDVTDNGLSGSEGQFLACSFWLVEALALIDREAEARELFERLLALRKDLGLYAEEYDVARGRPGGNFRRHSPISP